MFVATCTVFPLLPPYLSTLHQPSAHYHTKLHSIRSLTTTMFRQCFATKILSLQLLSFISRQQLHYMYNHRHFYPEYTELIFISFITGVINSLCFFRLIWLQLHFRKIRNAETSTSPYDQYIYVLRHGA